MTHKDSNRRGDGNRFNKGWATAFRNFWFFGFKIPQFPLSTWVCSGSVVTRDSQSQWINWWQIDMQALWLILNIDVHCSSCLNSSKTFFRNLRINLLWLMECVQTTCLDVLVPGCCLFARAGARLVVLAGATPWFDTHVCGSGRSWQDHGAARAPER